ncbi:MAG: zinc-ribbon domain-containing protein [Caldilineaceae bacterium]
MLWLTIGIALVLAVLAIGFVAWPLWRPATLLRVDEDNPLTELVQRKDALLLSIKELEFDYQTGKLSAADYQRLDQRLRHQAIGLLRQLEKDLPATGGLEAELEAAILRQRQILAPPPKPIANGASVDPTRFCTQCGAPVTATDNFCAKCGAPVRKSAEPQVG